MRNPWIGLSSYDEKMISKGYKFCGRSNATMELYSLVDNNINVTLYGKSGTGKSSLLCAGLFPKLRANNYFPVYVRFDIKDITSSSYSGIIVNTLQDALTKAEFSYSTAGELPSTDSNEYLWSYFANTEFRNNCGNVIFPVLVFDQFEELFFGDKQLLAQLLKQLYLLIDDSTIQSSNKAEIPVSNFRILFSLREDDFFRLEDIIEKLRLVEMKYNRYRLTELKDDEAREIILVPGDGIIDENNAEEIAKQIITTATGENGEINSAVLSLLCSRLREFSIKKHGGVVTLEAVEDFFKKSNDNFMASFYDDVIAELKDRKKWEYIEDELVGEDGRRKSILKEEFDKHVPNSGFLFKGKYAILHKVTYSTSNKPYVEIIHDMLAKHMKESRNNRHHTNEIRRMRLRFFRYAFFSLLIIIFLVWALNNELTAVRVTQENKGLKENQKNLYWFQSHVLAEESLKEFEKDSFNKAMRIVLYSFDDSVKNRKYAPLAEQMLRSCDFFLDKEYAHYDGEPSSDEVLQNGDFLTYKDEILLVYHQTTDGIKERPDSLKHESKIKTFAVSKKGNYVATVTEKERIRLFKLGVNGLELVTNPLKCKDVKAVAFSKDGKCLVINPKEEKKEKVWQLLTLQELVTKYKGKSEFELSQDEKDKLHLEYKDSAY